MVKIITDVYQYRYLYTRTYSCSFKNYQTLGRSFLYLCIATIYKHYTIYSHLSKITIESNGYFKFNGNQKSLH